jgi:hypothetical protein
MTNRDESITGNCDNIDIGSSMSNMNSGKWTVNGEVNTIKETVKV